MITGVNLVQALDDSLEATENAITETKRLAIAKAEAERRYRIEKRKRTLYERDYNKTPVSIIADVVKGYQDIADLAFQRDCAEAEWEASRESILYQKRLTDTIREQIKREWSQAGEQY